MKIGMLTDSLADLDFDTVLSTAASLAARNRTNEDIDRLRELDAARKDSWSSGDSEERVSADLQLHSAIVAATHNPLYMKLYASMLTVFAVHMRDETSDDEDAAHLHHHELVEAIAAGDSERAAAAVAAIFEPFMR